MNRSSNQAFVPTCKSFLDPSSPLLPKSSQKFRKSFKRFRNRPQKLALSILLPSVDSNMLKYTLQLYHAPTNQKKQNSSMSTAKIPKKWIRSTKSPSKVKSNKCTSKQLSIPITHRWSSPTTLKSSRKPNLKWPSSWQLLNKNTERLFLRPSNQFKLLNNLQPLSMKS